MNEFDYIRNQVIGSVEFVSPSQIKVLLEINAPANTAINTGSPQLFPKVNGFVLIPNETGSLIGIISWIGIEYSQYPKRKGYKDFDLIDLPFPLRKLSVCPLGLLKEKGDDYEIERGVYNYPSVGDSVIIPNQKQLRAIVQNKDGNAKVKIGISPMAANAPVYINPDKVFGRHTAVLGNTGSGKSCSVAGLIRWSLQEAKNSSIAENKKLNSRYIIIDPNGEYCNCFNDLGNVRRYQVSPDSVDFQQLKVPSWMWNSFEWSSIAQASGKTQRPLLRQALREIKGSSNLPETQTEFARRFILSLYIRLRKAIKDGISAYSEFPGKQNIGEVLNSANISLSVIILNGEPEKSKLTQIKNSIDVVVRKKTKDARGYYPPFDLLDLQSILNAIEDSQSVFGDFTAFDGPDEDTPLYFNNMEFINYIEQLAFENNSSQFMDFFIMRVKSILKDSRISSVINTNNAEEVMLTNWLSNYIGKNEDNGSISILDLSLLPSDISFVIVSVVSRLIFEAHQRYRRLNKNILPTTLVIEEAHNFIKKYSESPDEITAANLCSQTFEKIAKEGRKFGLGLLISSQRPSELSQTVLSQCNTFLLHRLVNDKDQEMVKKLVPDNLGSVLEELPVLPTKKAIILGWAAPIPLLVEMNNLELQHRPESKDPDFWDVWTGNSVRPIDWNIISDDWQGLSSEA